MHRSLILPTATWLALLAPHARAQMPSPQQEGKAPYASPPPMLLLTPHGGGPERPLYHLVRTDQPRTLSWGPGPAGMTLAWVGRRMQWFDRAHTWQLGHAVASPVRSLPGAAHFGPTAYGQQTTDFFGPPAARATPQRMTSRDEEAPPAPAAPVTSTPVLLPRLAVPPPTSDNIAVIPWDH